MDEFQAQCNGTLWQNKIETYKDRLIKKWLLFLLFAQAVYMFCHPGSFNKYIQCNPSSMVSSDWFNIYCQSADWISEDYNEQWDIYLEQWFTNGEQKVLWIVNWTSNETL